MITLVVILLALVGIGFLGSIILGVLALSPVVLVIGVLLAADYVLFKMFFKKK